MGAWPRLWNRAHGRAQAYGCARVCAHTQSRCTLTSAPSTQLCTSATVWLEHQVHMEDVGNKQQM